jgi:hypothetical protein
MRPAHGRAANRGPDWRSAPARPVWGAPAERVSSGRHGHRVARATARASSSAWSNPRRRRRAVEVGAQVTRRGSGGVSAARADPSRSTSARSLRYLSPTTSRRPVPS